MTDYSELGGRFMYYPARAWEYLKTLPSYIAPGSNAPSLPQKGNNDLLGDPKAVPPKLGEGKYNNITALKPLMTEFVNIGLKDKQVSQQLTSIMMNPLASRDPANFLKRFVEAVAEAPYAKYGPANNPNREIVGRALIEVLKNGKNKDGNNITPTDLLRYIENKNGAYQLTPEGEKVLSEPMANYILHPPSTPQSPSTQAVAPGGNNTPAKNGAPARTPPATRKRNDDGLLSQFDKESSGKRKKGPPSTVPNY